MSKKIFLFLGALALFVSTTVTAPKAEANDTLGIIGTALGGSALALGAFNTYSLYRGGLIGNRWGRGGGWGGGYYGAGYGGWGGGYGGGYYGAGVPGYAYYGGYPTTYYGCNYGYGVGCGTAGYYGGYGWY